jgi:hypothetical protein
MRKGIAERAAYDVAFPPGAKAEAGPTTDHGPLPTD